MAGINPAASTGHVPVMAERVLELLAPALSTPGSVYLDGTLGLGGHAAMILNACPKARLVGIDRDRHALEIAAERLAPFGDRVRLFRAVYHEMGEVLQELGIDAVQAICLDLGLSSLQIDRPERGFSYSVDAPLDMRMDPDTELTAATIINTWPVTDLARILSEYAQERFARRIAEGVANARRSGEITSSAQLAAIITQSIPAAARTSGGHPAKRTFQALRIAVNDELSSLDRVLPVALAALAPAGRLVVLSYHSGEDRLVKRAFATATSDRVPSGVPVVPKDYRAGYRLLTRGAERPSSREVECNPRSASARLRAIVRIGQDRP